MYPTLLGPTVLHEEKKFWDLSNVATKKENCMGLIFQIPEFCPSMVSGKGFNFNFAYNYIIIARDQHKKILYIKYFVMLISRSIISWFAELGESSNQSNSPASIPRTIHQCHHCTGALSSSTSSISSSSLSSSTHHHHRRHHHHQWHSGWRWANGVFDLGAKFARNIFAQEPSVQQVIKCSS